jgi:hypothetical protein
VCGSGGEKFNRLSVWGEANYRYYPPSPRFDVQNDVH